MSVALYGCLCGELACPNGAMAQGAQGMGRFPLPFYLIEHPLGRVLFDCGLHADMADPDNGVRARLAAGGLAVHLGPGESVVQRLQALDVAPETIGYVVLSHLHFDHVGGLHQIPNAELVVQRKEWETGLDPERAARHFLNRPYFDLGHPVKLIEGDHDLFGDGRVTCLASYGHTPGHQSLRVRSEDADYILTADACYFCDVVQTRAFPAFGDAEAMNASIDRLVGLSQSSTTLVFGHDPAQWGRDGILKTSR